MSTPEPTVVLLATIDHGAVRPGFCGRCLDMSAERRSRLRLYADIRPATLARAEQRTHTTALLCQHFAHKQANGAFTCANAMLLCSACLMEDLRSLGFPEDPLDPLAGDGSASPAPEGSEATGDADNDDAPRYALFVHLPQGLEGRSVIVLSTLPPGMELADVLTEECLIGVPPRTSEAQPESEEERP